MCTNTQYANTDGGVSFLNLENKFPLSWADKNRVRERNASFCWERIILPGACV